MKTFETKAQLERAAKSGDPDALYIQGKDFMKQHAWLKAKDKFWKAAESGHAMSMLELGRLKGSKKSGFDYNAADEWYQKAIASGEKEVFSQLGLMYLKEDGVKLDVFKGVSMLSTAKEKGDNNASIILSAISNSKENLQLVNQNDANGIFRLAKYLYENSQYSQECFDLSLSWLKKSGDLGSDNACMMLGEIYYNGSAKADRNIVAAKHWFEKALKYGNDEAAERLSHYRNCATIQFSDSYATFFDGNFYYNCYNPVQAEALIGSISSIPFGDINEIRIVKSQNECTIITNNKTLDFSFAHDVNNASDQRECNKFLEAINDDFIFVRSEKEVAGKVANGIFKLIIEIVGNILGIKLNSRAVNIDFSVDIYSKK